MAEVTYLHEVRPFGRDRTDARIQARAAAVSVEQDRDDMRSIHRQMLLSREITLLKQLNEVRNELMILDGG